MTNEELVKAMRNSAEISRECADRIESLVAQEVQMQDVVRRYKTFLAVANKEIERDVKCKNCEYSDGHMAIDVIWCDRYECAKNENGFCDEGVDKHKCTNESVTNTYGGEETRV